MRMGQNKTAGFLSFYSPSDRGVKSIKFLPDREDLHVYKLAPEMESSSKEVEDELHLTERARNG